jgi:predicted dehydrogenase
MFSLSRREFLTGSALLAAAAAGCNFPPEEAEPAADPPAQANPGQGGAPARLNVAVIGVRGRGMDHINGFLNSDLNCTITHICDADTAVTGPAMQRVERAQGQRPTFVQDLRRIMDNRDIHVVSIATPNHWHALAAIWALQAGKDVYVEKPVSHNVSEGRRIVEAARRHNRICQTGTQIRSASGVRQAIQFLRDGRLGQIRVARGLCYKRRNSIGRAQGNPAVPATVDYNLWCGPAPRNPLRRQRLHYDWHWFWDYGNGDLGNQGIHQMDVARWGLGKNELARSVISVGGRFGYVDDGQTANTQICVFDYTDAKLIFEVRGLPTGAQRGVNVGNIFHCADGYMVFPNYTTAVAYDNDGREIRRWRGRDTHYANFVAAVRSRRRADLNADILEGHLSSALCHLANISYRLGAEQPLGRQVEALRNDRDASDTLAAMREHLRTNDVPAATTNLRVGPRLNVNPETEQFTNNAEANRYLTRQYRAGFVVPARI